MGESAGLSGPDLSEGVAAESIVEGRPLLGHAGGESVMLVRAGGALYATSSSCSHYGGPLAEGLVVGKTVRCPWHHACFDLESGAGRGPGMTPIACFDIVNEKGLVRVSKKREPTQAGPLQSGTSVVIVGGGPAGAACAETLRRMGYDGSITLVADEPPGPVDRPNLSKDYLAGNAPEEWIPIRDAGFYQDNRVDFRLGGGAKSIDPKGRTVELADGSRLPYRALLLATGAEPRRLPIPGGDGAKVHVLRTLADSRAIIEAANEGGRAVILGSSFIGLEVAASLRARKVEVEVVSPDAIPLARVLGDELGAFVRNLHEEHGVRFHLGRKPARIAEAAKGVEVELEDGTKLQADFVVQGVGVAPRTALAEAAGLKVDRGIVVDDRLRTSAEGIFAAGDVASYPDPWSGDRVRIEHWVVAQRQGQAVAAEILGVGASGYRDVPFFWSAHYDVTIGYVGHASSWDRIVSRGDLGERKAVRAFERGGKILAAACVGEDDLCLRIEAAMQAGDAAAVASLLGS